MTDQQIARYLLHIWELMYKKWVRPNISATCQTAVDNRLTTLKNAVTAGNVPDMSALVRRYLKLPDNSVLLHNAAPEQEWTAAEWAAAKVELDNIIVMLQGELATHQQYAARVEELEASIAKQEATKAEMESV